MGIATVTVYGDSRRDAAVAEREAAVVLMEAGAQIERVEVLEQAGNKLKIRFHGDMEEVITGSTLEDLVSSLWLKIGGYCWTHVSIHEGGEDIQEKFDRGDYRELIG